MLQITAGIDVLVQAPASLLCSKDDSTCMQAQALPVVMSGRDCIGVAKTGSGKTLAFVLPMLRHIKV